MTHGQLVSAMKFATGSSRMEAASSMYLRQGVNEKELVHWLGSFIPTTCSLKVVTTTLFHFVDYEHSEEHMRISSSLFQGNPCLFSVNSHS